LELDEYSGRDDYRCRAGDRGSSGHYDNSSDLGLDQRFYYPDDLFFLTIGFGGLVEVR
jgi:hypothetical protein